METEATVLRKKYGHGVAHSLLWRWAGGSGALGESGGDDAESSQGKSEEQVRAEECARAIRTVREGVLWFLRRGLEGAVSVQRSMVEKRIERAREKEKSVLYKVAGASAGAASGMNDGSFPTGGGGGSVPGKTSENPPAYGGSSKSPTLPTPDAAVLSEADTARIEAQLSPEQLQLFAEENDSMLRHYEDTLGKVQYVFSSHFSISPTPSIRK